MTGLLVRALLAIGGGTAALLLNRDAPSFLIVQSMLALVAVVLALAAAAAWLFQRRASSGSRPWTP